MLEKTIQNLNKNGIETYVVEKKEDVIDQFCKIVKPQSSIGVGGSMSLVECGLLDFVKGGNYSYVERAVTTNTDFFLCSTNAVTQNGELYNVDGRSNRICYIAYGPKNVILIVGINKIVKDLDEAVLRVKTIAAPKNCVRLNCNTPCAKTGKCVSLTKENPSITDGCGENSICCNYLISARQREKGRIKIIFVKENLGY